MRLDSFDGWDRGCLDNEQDPGAITGVDTVVKLVGNAIGFVGHAVVVSSFLTQSWTSVSWRRFLTILNVKRTQISTFRDSQLLCVPGAAAGELLKYKSAFMGGRIKDSSTPRLESLKQTSKKIQKTDSMS
ncbi:hypothetical protein FRB96_008093 [Tulasnella sp. 330]|nr:hypothetical protein FRB96_008093 [Tulasnella sp. 330]KAG8871922.1 hypothetical protein FRB98_000404 [Tulasnella sp. 332]